MLADSGRAEQGGLGQFSLIELVQLEETRSMYLFTKASLPPHFHMDNFESEQYN